MNVKETVRHFLLENFLFTDNDAALKDDDSFLAAGIIDSTGVLEIILFIEDTFDIKVDDDEMLPENLDSVNHLAAFVARKHELAVAA